MIRDNAGIEGFMGINGTMLEMLFVHPRAIGTGIGKQLMRYALEHISQAIAKNCAVCRTCFANVSEKGRIKLGKTESMVFDFYTMLSKAKRTGTGRSCSAIRRQPSVLQAEIQKKK